MKLSKCRSLTRLVRILYDAALQGKRLTRRQDLDASLWLVHSRTIEAHLDELNLNCWTGLCRLASFSMTVSGIPGNVADAHGPS